MQSADSEREGAAGAAVYLRADRLTVDLAGEIDHQRVVHGDHVVVRGDRRDVVGVAHAVQLVPHVAVDLRELLGRERPERRADYLARMHRLAAARDDALLDERRNAAEDQLGVHAELSPVREERREAGGNRARAHLYRVAVAHDLVRDERADDRRHRALVVGARRPLQVLPRGRRFDELLEARDVDPIVAAGADEALVDFADDMRCLARYFGRSPDAHAEAAPAFVVRR